MYTSVSVSSVVSSSLFSKANLAVALFIILSSFISEYFTWKLNSSFISKVPFTVYSVVHIMVLFSNVHLLSFDTIVPFNGNVSVIVNVALPTYSSTLPVYLSA